MTRSPQRLLVISIIICLLLGSFLDLISQNPSLYPSFFYPHFPVSNEYDFSLTSYYWGIGDFDKAIVEYQRVLPSLPKDEANSANREFKRMLIFEKSTQGKIIHSIVYYSWLLPPRLYELAFLFFLLLVFLFAYRHIKKMPKFVIQNFYNYTNLSIGSNLPQIAIDRIHEITWRAQNLESSSGLIADNIEIPTLSLMSEGDNQSAVEFLEIAMMFSIGSSNLPFSNMINAIKLWLEQPHFLVRGLVDRGENTINFKLSLLNRENNIIEKIWDIEIPYKEGFSISNIVDATIYPLLYYFNGISAARWEALQALHNGLEEFQLFKEDQSRVNHLKLAQQHFEYALDLDPGYGLAKYNLSLLLIATGEFEKAKDHLKELAAANEDSQLKIKSELPPWSSVILNLTRLGL